MDVNISKSLWTKIYTEQNTMEYGFEEIAIITKEDIYDVPL